ncbi:glycosyltransferase [Leptolyngbya sp. PCC 7375]|nr:glycosyltransferase [Leptolyngbya sp. PCC 7375]
MALKQKHSSSDYVLYIGSYLNSKIVEQRGLPTFNVAGSNRMHRLANALRTANQNVMIVSPAASLRMKWTGKLFHIASIAKTGHVPVFFCPAFGLPVINSLLETITLLWSIILISRRVNVKTAIVYNFNPALVVISLFLKYILGIRIFNNIEDVSRPKLDDWRKTTEVRPLQQIIFSTCMDIIANLSEGLVIPTKRFLPDLPTNKPALVISGCMPLNKISNDFQKVKYPINILFSGKIEFEHGIHFFIDSLEQLQSDLECNINDNLVINICGAGTKTDWLTEKIDSLKDLPINYFGFVSTEQYQDLLQSADICVALQNPQGRYSNYKTPSKVYEYLGHGKLVVATPVGDLPNLPTQVIDLCDSDIRSSLKQILRKLVINTAIIQKRRELTVKYARENFSFPEVGNTLKAFVLAE